MTKNNNIVICLIFFFLFLYGLPCPVSAVDITVPATIVNPGYYELKNDIINSTTGISIVTKYFPMAHYTWMVRLW
jgi:hypothetical protein